MQSQHRESDLLPPPGAQAAAAGARRRAAAGRARAAARPAAQAPRHLPGTGTHSICIGIDFYTYVCYSVRSIIKEENLKIYPTVKI